ncbi:MAG: transglycosylase SLT domain-containing protein [Bacteroidales bacterium]
MKTRINTYRPLISFAILLTIVIATRCNHHSSEVNEGALPDTLRIGTLYGATSYFIYKGEEMGYEYELINNFAHEKGIEIKSSISNNIESLLEQLDSAHIDLIAYQIPRTAKYNSDNIIYCGIENITHQVLVQPKAKEARELITDVTQLIGEDIYIQKNSKYISRLQNLNNELGGGINIHTTLSDTLVTDDILYLVATDSIPLTIIDWDQATLNISNYKNIDTSLEISFPQRSSWVVSSNNKLLADSINHWSSEITTAKSSKNLMQRYFQLSRIDKSDSTTIIGEANKYFGHISLKSQHVISPYDSLFRKYAKEIGWDWRLLAAQSFSESRFDPTATSWAGARGLMQLMPSTARAFGLEGDSITDPELNIKAATAYIKSLQRAFANKVEDPHERNKFILAAYNSGLGHIYDAIALAKAHNRDPETWDDNVEITITMKSNPEFYNEEVCRHGYFNGRETENYVAKVMALYNLYKTQIEK